MPWKETSVMDQRIRFIADWLSEDYRKTELCAAYGISRPTADKWMSATPRAVWEALRVVLGRRTRIPMRRLGSCVR